MSFPLPSLSLRLSAAVAALALSACVATDPPRSDAARAEVVLEEAAEALPAPVVAEPVASDAAAAPPLRSASPRSPRRGVLTAGDIDDGLNLPAFRRYLARAGRETGLPQLPFGRAIRVELVGPDGDPAPGVRYTLRRPGAADPFHTGYSGVDGRITVFPELLGAGRLSEVRLTAFPEAEGTEMQTVIPVDTTTAVYLDADSRWQPDFLDLAFVVDTTGSMHDELDWLTRELSGIVRAARRAAPGVDIRYGLVVYRDKGDAYVVRNYGFTGSEQQMIGWLRAQEAAGGGDYPEAAAAALRAGAGLNWRRGKGERLMVHIADAPPHDRDARAYLGAVRTALARDVQVYGLGASGVASESEYLMRQAAAATQGRYVFLTDDSGVGNAHAEPSVSCYRVTRLSGLMVRILRSELSGRRVEAGGGEVLREVGSYAGGVCRD
jgi:hypothetical protein